MKPKIAHYSYDGYAPGEPLVVHRVGRRRPDLDRHNPRRGEYYAFAYEIYPRRSTTRAQVQLDAAFRNLAGVV